MILLNALIQTNYIDFNEDSFKKKYKIVNPVVNFTLFLLSRNPAT